MDQKAMHLMICALCFGAFFTTVDPAAAQHGKGQFRLSSPDVSSTMKDQQVYNSFGCTGGNVSPALQWSGAPAGTKSFVVPMYDPDAPTGSGWWQQPNHID